LPARFAPFLFYYPPPPLSFFLLTIPSPHIGVSEKRSKEAEEADEDEFERANELVEEEPKLADGSKYVEGIDFVMPRIEDRVRYLASSCCVRMNCSYSRETFSA
jgi:hypothetical protein